MTNSEKKETNLFTSAYIEGERFRTEDGDNYARFETSLTEKQLQEIIVWCNDRKASDIWIAGDDFIRAKFGSRKRPVTDFKIGAENMKSLLQDVVKDSGLNALESGLAVDLKYTFVSGNNNHENYSPTIYEFRLNAIGVLDETGQGKTYEISLRSFATEPPSALKDLHIEREIFDNFIVKEGLNLVTGGTGNGKTTLIYGIYRDLGEDPSNNLRVIDYGKPIEYRLPGKLNFHNNIFKQTEVGEMLKPPIENPSDDLEWREAGKTSLRRAADIINIAEARDTAAFRQIMESSSTGHLGVTTLHTNSVAATFQRGINFFAFAEQQSRGFDLINILNLVVCQRLFPKADGQGVAAVREYMVFTDAVKQKLINSNTHPSEWSSLIEELMRKFSGKKDPRCPCLSMKDHANSYPEGTFRDEDLKRLNDLTSYEPL